MYGNYKVYHPLGHLMFYCSEKKYNWYLKRNIAIKIDDKSIQLTFEPKGFGEEPRFLEEERKNICVVSGKYEDLTKHHIVPTQFRQHFPDVYKSKNSHDVVVMTREEHDKYERIADVYKEELMNKYITKEEIQYNIDLNNLQKVVSTIDNYSHVIPKERLNKLSKRIDKLKNRLNIVVDEINLLKPIDYNILIVERMGVESLILEWKKHFIENAKPNFLPEWWEVDYIKIIDERD